MTWPPHFFRVDVTSSSSQSINRLNITNGCHHTIITTLDCSKMYIQVFYLFLCLASSVNAFVPKVYGSTTLVSSPSWPQVTSVTRPSSTYSVSRNLAAVPDAETPVVVENPFARLERKRRLGTAMAFLTGWADLTLFKKYQTFATMMTGNTMWMAVAAVERRFVDVAYYASVIVSYLTGLSIFRRTDLSLTKKTLPVCAFLVPALFVGSDVLFSIYQHRWIPMMMLAMGFGIINALGTEVTGTLTFVRDLIFCAFIVCYFQYSKVLIHLSFLFRLLPAT